MKKWIIIILLLLMIDVLASSIDTDTIFLSDNVQYRFDEEYDLTNKLVSFDCGKLDLNHKYIFNITPSSGMCNISIITINSTKVEWNLTCPATVDSAYHIIGNFSETRLLKINDINNISLLQSGGYISLNYTSGGLTNDFSLENYTYPKADSVNIVPSPAGASDDLNCTYEYIGDFDESTAYFRWYIDDILSGIETQILGSAHTSDNQNISCSIMVYDGAYNSTSWRNSTVLVIGDTTPAIIENSTINPISGTVNVDSVKLRVDVFADSYINWVKVEVTSPDTTKQNYSMASETGNTYLKSFVAADTGIYTFKGFALDGSGVISNITYTQSYISSSATSPTLPPGGSSGTSPPGIDTICGNGICEVGENDINCPEDCANISFKVSPQLFRVVVWNGKVSGASFTIKNPNPYPIAVRMCFKPIKNDTAYLWGNLTSGTLVQVPAGSEASPGMEIARFEVDVPIDTDSSHRFNIICQSKGGRVAVTYIMYPTFSFWRYFIETGFIIPKLNIKVFFWWIFPVFGVYLVGKWGFGRYNAGKS